MNGRDVEAFVVLDDDEELRQRDVLQDAWPAKKSLTHPRSVAETESLCRLVGELLTSSLVKH